MFEELRLPSPDEFVRQALRIVEPVIQERTELKVALVPDQIAKVSLAKAAGSGVSDEFRGLIVQYCASCIQAIELTEVDFKPLANRLGTRLEFIEEAAATANRNEQLWVDVIAERVRRVGADRTIKNVTWERVEGRALQMIDKLLEKNLIRDTGELLAIANQARKVSDSIAGINSNPHGNQQGTTVNLNFGGSEMNDGLPASGAKMTIDLSPRLANSLSQRGDRPGNGNRVIDSTMLSAKELREMLAQQQAEAVTTVLSQEGA